MTTFDPTRGDWCTDPSGRHQFRFHDADWSEWVADAGVTGLDPDGAEAIRHRRRTRRTIGWVVGILIAAILLLGLFAVGQGYEDISRQEHQAILDERSAIHREFDTWVLPASLQATGTLERSGVDDPYAYETRTYVPAGGASTEQAVADLQTVLLARGWMYPYDEAHPWSARKQGIDATMQIFVEAGRIQVEIDG